MLFLFLKTIKADLYVEILCLGSPPKRGDYWNQGVDAEILEPKSGEWKKGKMRMRVILEFCPDEPEVKNDTVQQNGNSLDDIRQAIS